tara:strand:+ start:374 stop:745 length:372 start_codon:yes stop_codon:yes gene_type:complete
MSWNSFSQTVTDTTKIVLTKPIAKLVIKDLIKFDGLEQSTNTLEELLAETNGKLNTSLELNKNLNLQVKNYQTILNDKDKQLETSDFLSKDLQAELKIQARTQKLYKIGSTVGAVALALLLIK